MALYWETGGGIRFSKFWTPINLQHDPEDIESKDCDAEMQPYVWCDILC